MVDPDSPGLTRQAIDVVLEEPEKQFTLFFDNVEVPAENLIGHEGRGLRVAFDGLNPERILSAAVSVGIGRCAGQGRRIRKAAGGLDQPIGHIRRSRIHSPRQRFD